MISEKLLSIIVPSYNMEAYLAKNISSMMVQDEASRQRVEVIVVNDGSRDRTSEIAHDFAERYPGCITVIDKPNGHYGSCINAALPVAKGKYIRVLDADDYADKEVFERFLSFLSDVANEDELDLVISDICHVDPDGKITAQTKYNLPKDASFTLNSIADWFTDFVGLHAITYRTSMLREMNYRQTEGCAYTDTEWFIVPMTRVRKVRYFNQVVMCYLVGRDGQTMQPEIFERDFGVVIKIFEGIVRLWPQLDKDATKDARGYIQALLERKVYWLYRFVLLSKRPAHLNDALKVFDSTLKAEMPLFYEKCSIETTPSRKFNFKYVKVWRKSYTTKTVLFSLYYGYVALLQRFYKLRGVK